MKHVAFNLSCVSAIALAACVGTSARAAQTTDGQAGRTTTTAAADDTMASDEIIVTALRRSENVLKVPVTIAVLKGENLRSVGVSTINDVQNLVPGLSVGNGPFGTTISIRGVTSTDQTSKGQMGIAFNINGAFVGRSQEQGVAFFDLERIEVLKGPQGTLYGRSSTGGAINLITKKPVLDTVEGYAKAEYGNYNTKRAEAAINLPLGTMFALRIAGSMNDRNGYLTPADTKVVGSPAANNGAGPASANLLGAGLPAKNDQVDQTGRATLLFKPSDDLTATIVATVGHIGGFGAGGASLSNFTISGASVFDIAPNYVPSHVDKNFHNFNEQVNWRLGAVQVDVLGSQQHFTDRSQQTGSSNPFNTGNPTAAAAFTLQDYNGVFKTDQYEVRMSNVDKGVVEYVAGANYFHETINESDHNWLAPLTATGGLSDSSKWVNGIDPVNTTQHKSYGVFGQVTVHATDRIAVIGGLRYTKDETQREGTFSVGPVLGCLYPNDCIGGPNNGSASNNKVTWRVGLNFQATPEDLIYTSIATGYKAGGFNDFDPSTGAASTYGPEQLTAFEVGYKGRPLPGLTVTSAAFYYDFSKAQINGLTLFPTSAGVVGVLFTQLTPVEIYGLEGEVNYQLGRSTTLNAALAYQHSRFVGLQTGFLGYLTGKFADFSGYPLPNAPEFVANLSVNHGFALGNGAELRLRGAMKFSSGYDLTDFANAIRYRQDSFTRSDTSVTYAAADDRYTVQLFVENIENKLQRTAGPNSYNGGYGGFTGGVPTAEANGTAFPLQSVNFGVARPRFYGIRVGAKF